MMMTAAIAVVAVMLLLIVIVKFDKSVNSSFGHFSAFEIFYK